MGGFYYILKLRKYLPKGIESTMLKLQLAPHESKASFLTYYDYLFCLFVI